METLSKLKSQLNTPEQGSPLFAGWQLQQLLTACKCFELNVESTSESIGIPCFQF
jgi:hypothetical protein